MTCRFRRLDGKRLLETKEQKLLLSTSQAIMLYVAEMWVDETKLKQYQTCEWVELSSWPEVI